MTPLYECVLEGVSNSALPRSAEAGEPDQYTVLIEQLLASIPTDVTFVPSDVRRLDLRGEIVFYNWIGDSGCRSTV